jgi:hypothetical protein
MQATQIEDTINDDKSEPPTVDLEVSSGEVENTEGKGNSKMRECYICTEVIGKPRDEDPAEEETTTPCGHHFGKDCLDRWLQDNTTCPLCRSRLVFLPQVQLLAFYDLVERLIDRTEDINLTSDPYIVEYAYRSEDELEVIREVVKSFLLRRMTFHSAMIGRCMERMCRWKRGTPIMRFCWRIMKVGDVSLLLRAVRLLLEDGGGDAVGIVLSWRLSSGEVIWCV